MYKATVQTIDWGCISIRSKEYEYTGELVDVVELSDGDFALIFRDLRTNQPFAVISKE